jgi:hypothetical protein
LSDAPKSSPEVPELSDEARAAPSNDDRFAAALRGFGPLGIVAILVIRVAPAPLYNTFDDVWRF